MTKFAIPAGAAALALLAACTPPAPSTIVVDAPPPADSCNASAYQQYVGQKSPDIRLPSGTIVRDYRTGDPITMDMSPARINFEYDRSGTLVKVSCG